MKTLVPVAAALLLFAAAPFLQAREPLDLDVDTAVALALRSNLGIEAEQLSLEMKRLLKDTAYNVFYPRSWRGRPSPE